LGGFFVVRTSCTFSFSLPLAFIALGALGLLVVLLLDLLFLPAGVLST